MPRFVKLPSAGTDAWVDSCIGTLLDERHYDPDKVFSGEHVDVYKPNGELLFVLRRGVIPDVAYMQCYEALLRAARRTENRPDAAAGRESIRSGTIGYLYGELTYATTSDLAGYQRITLLLAEMDRLFAKYRKREYAALREAAAQTTKHILPTVFSSAAVNRTEQMGVHQDDGNLPGGYGAMTVVRAGEYTGGLLVFPKYRVAVDLYNGDCLIADNKEAHGNTEMQGEEGFERVSVVAYFHSSNLPVYSPACRQAAYRQRGRLSVHFSSASDEWSTPPELFAELDQEFNFTLDACATPENAHCVRYFTREDNGLAQRWTGRVWCNPPYGRAIGLWMRKAWESVQTGEAEVVVCLVPARSDTSWWHEYAVRGEVRFLRGRLRFGGAKSSAPFPSAVVVFRNMKR
jgi:phage N-6-adenine-methyltransferase